MKENPSTSSLEQTSELLIMPDGQILVHNLTLEMAGLLTGLDPSDVAMQQRAARTSGVSVVTVAIPLHHHSDAS